MKIKTININKYFFAIFILGLFSCKEDGKESNIAFDLKKNDQIYNRVSKIPENQLTEIEIPQYIDLDTIKDNHKMVNITIRNKGVKNLSSLFIKPPCSCIQMPKYDSIMLPNESQTLSIDVKFDEIGNFYKPITIYGSFYPYIKKIYVEGYRSK